MSWQGHGTLHAIYASIKKSCEVNNWEGVDLLIIGGDFQVRIHFRPRDRDKPNKLRQSAIATTSTVCPYLKSSEL